MVVKTTHSRHIVVYPYPFKTMATYHLKGTLQESSEHRHLAVWALLPGEARRKVRLWRHFLKNQSYSKQQIFFEAVSACSNIEPRFGRTVTWSRIDIHARWMYLQAWKWETDKRSLILSEPVHLVLLPFLQRELLDNKSYSFMHQQDTKHAMFLFFEKDSAHILGGMTKTSPFKSKKRMEVSVALMARLCIGMTSMHDQIDSSQQLSGLSVYTLG